MTNDATRWFVLIPCSSSVTWAVPQNCLAEIVTLHSNSDEPPEEVMWRGRTVPIIDLGADDSTPWREPRRGTALVAIFLGLKGEGCEYWGVAVRGEGLSVERVTPAEVEDAPESVMEHATAAFIFRGALCQVPDLDGLQKKIAAKLSAAHGRAEAG